MLVKKIYLDYAATTPVDKEVYEAMRPYFFEKFGNPSSVHFAGQEALIAIDEARQKVADFFGASPQEIIFTGSATESNNLAIKGVIKALRNNLTISQDLKLHIITTNIEHESIHEPLRDLEKDGLVEVSYISVEKDGIILVEKIKNAIKENTVLVSVMYVNNEIGTIQPIKEIANAISKFKSHKLGVMGYPLFHVDAVQAINYLNCDVNDLSVDLLSFSGHKIYGPKGTGGLYIKDDIMLKPIILGGGQEYRMRSGTENVPYIVGLAKALDLVKKNQEKDIKNILKLREKLFEGILKIYSKAKVNGDLENRIPANLNILFPGVDANMLLIALSEKGIAVSMGSACQSKALNPSHVLTAMGLSKKDANSSLRFSLGRYTTELEINMILKILKEIKNYF